ncbi:hypothetical protein Avbf_09623 [Armadillidium vulgare]|nr:hypothetical protein Avbf_09623 [Armadillidium vulgare]
MNLVEEQIISTLKSMVRASSNVRLVKGEGESNPIAETMLQSFLTVRIQCYDTLSQIAKQAIVGGRLSLLNVKKKNKKKGYTVTSNECQSALGDVSASRAVEQKIPLTISALKFLETLFTYAHHSYQLKYVKVLQDHLMTLLKTRRLGIYGDTEVREALLSAVIANVLYPHPLCPPAYNFIYKALQDEALYSREQISGICMKGLSVLSFITSNPNTVNWSDVVSLNKESKNVRTIEEIEEPVLNGDANNEESDVSDNENDEAPEEEDEGEEDNESFRLNISDDEIESDDVDKEEEVNDVEDFRMEINEIGELTSADKDVGETIERLNNGDDGSNTENLVEDLQDDDEEDSFGVFDMSMNCNGVEDEEEEDIDETSDEDEELDEVVGDEEEKVVDEEEADTGVGLKRKIGSASDETTKRSKVEPDGDDDDDGVNPSVAEMLAAFVNEGPDSYNNR